MNPIIRFQNVIKRFGALTVLDNFNFEVQRGEKVTLIGPSGSGKSTVLRILMTLEPFQEGLLEIDGISYHEPDGRGPFKASEKHLHTIRSNVGMVFQSFNLFPHMTVLRNVVEAPVAVLKMKREEAESRCCAWSASMIRRITSRVSFRAGSSSASPSRVRLPCVRAFSCSMSRPPR
jgi:polar amino acid transport system ATP-binding protein